MIESVLVANRGEIAVRVIRACRVSGVRSVAVYSEADSQALHVQLADEAVSIGPSEPSESYLNVERILSAAKSAGVDAIHPGYGFLAENAAFAEAVESTGLVFIGPPASALRLMGDKIAAREAVSRSGVPVIPGATLSDDDPDKAAVIAAEVGYPVLVKAAAGGGGKGMRVVDKPEDLQFALESARRESESAFGDSTVFLERYLRRPRHVEFQVFADRHGNTVHLFERECSIQRRHQKVVEETPSTALTSDLRAEMGRAAVAAAEAAGYVNAGTVEFLLAEDGSFHFLEMNTRLQVEHPITEEVVGVDLVAAQLAVAGGEPLPWRQDELHQRGHAIECRVYAENPEEGFLPSPGKVLAYSEPVGPGVRVDSGVYAGFEIPPHYDPILSKLVVWGQDRDLAIRRTVAALDEYTLMGVATTIPFLRDVIAHRAFADGETHTDFIPIHFPAWAPRGSDEDETTAVLIAAAARAERGADTTEPSSQRRQPSPWQTLGSWEIAGS
jgi:acetyl-CoA carboxylase biotin carboxylase subunit